MYIKRLKINVTYTIPTCFRARAPSSGNLQYKGLQIPTQHWYCAGTCKLLYLGSPEDGTLALKHVGNSCYV